MMPLTTKTRDANLDGISWSRRPRDAEFIGYIGLCTGLVYRRTRLSVEKWPTSTRVLSTTVDNPEQPGSTALSQQPVTIGGMRGAFISALHEYILCGI